MLMMMMACQNTSNHIETQNDEFSYTDYIYDDQGLEKGDTSIHFDYYLVEITGDSVADYIYLATYMDNYFTYVFNGKTNEEIEQAETKMFHSKTGRKPLIQFLHVVQKGRNDILVYSVKGIKNDLVALDVYSENNNRLEVVYRGNIYNNGSYFDTRFGKEFPKEINIDLYENEFIYNNDIYLIENVMNHETKTELIDDFKYIYNEKLSKYELLNNKR